MQPERFLRTCPKCGSHLMLREGDNGDFLACPKFPACHHTESLPEGAWSKGDHGTLKLELRQSSPYCKECNRTGLLPFKRKDGSTVPHAFLDCECKLKTERDYYQPITPSDFDFPISYDFHRLLSREYGWSDPGDLTPNIETHEPVVTQNIHINIDKKALDLQNRIVRLEEEIKSLRPYKNKNKYTIKT